MESEFGEPMAPAERFESGIDAPLVEVADGYVVRSADADGVGVGREQRFVVSADRALVEIRYRNWVASASEETVIVVAVTYPETLPPVTVPADAVPFQEVAAAVVTDVDPDTFDGVSESLRVGLMAAKVVAAQTGDGSLPADRLRAVEPTVTFTDGESTGPVVVSAWSDGDRVVVVVLAEGGCVALDDSSAGLVRVNMPEGVACAASVFAGQLGR